MAGEAERLGLYGFGAAAHILAQLAVWQGGGVFAFTRPGDAAGQAFARSLGCAWAGGSDEAPPEPLDAAIIFAPVGRAGAGSAEAGAQGRPGGLRRHPHERHPVFPLCRSVGRARRIRSVANLTRADGREFLDLAARAGDPHRRPRAFPLAEANAALAAVRAGGIEGAAVLRP